MNKNEPKPPSIFKMGRTFTKELANYIKEGAPNVTPEAYAKRLAICKSCDQLMKQSMRCGSCGCLLEHKARWKTSDCPLTPSKWPEEILTKEEKENIPDEEG